LREIDASRLTDRRSRTPRGALDDGPPAPSLKAAWFGAAGVPLPSPVPLCAALCRSVQSDEA
jgi:hypothetical protein